MILGLAITCGVEALLIAFLLRRVWVWADTAESLTRVFERLVSDGEKGAPESDAERGLFVSVSKVLEKKYARLASPFDQKTLALVKLGAMGSDGEQKNAAIEACKRISKGLE